MATIKFELKESKKNSAGKAPIYVRFTSGSSRSYKSTEIWISPRRWNKKEQEVRKTQIKNDDHETLNAILAKIKSKSKEVIRDLVAENKMRELQGKLPKNITSRKIKRKTFHEDQDDPDAYFIAFGRKLNKRIKKEDRYNTYLKKRTILNKFEEWIENNSEIVGNDIAFSSITISLIKDYYTYLVEEKENSLNTAASNIRKLGTFYNNAIEEGLTSFRNAPFKYVSLPTTEVKKTYLEGTELNKLKSLTLERQSIGWHIRNYFFFQVYTAGLRISDLCTITWDAISDNRFDYTMKKTSGNKSLLLVRPARNILEKYKPHKSGELIFPVLSKPLSDYSSNFELTKEINACTKQINYELKKLSGRAKIDKNLTTHIARHTFANNALKSGWSTEDIQQALGHSSIKTTEKYLSYFNQDSIDSNMKNLFREDWLDTQKSA